MSERSRVRRGLRACSEHTEPPEAPQLCCICSVLAAASTGNVKAAEGLWVQPPAWSHIYCLWLFNRCRITCFSFMSSQHLLPWQPQTSSAFFYRKFKVKNWNFWVEFYLCPSWYGNILRRETKAVELFCRFWTSNRNMERKGSSEAFNSSPGPPGTSAAGHQCFGCVKLNEFSFYCSADVLEGRIPGGFL